MRRKHRLNLLATLLFSHGTPMLLAGDEFGNGQGGNNNAYAQDNETGWLDWRRLNEDPDFVEQVRELLRLRRELPMLRQARYIHGRMPTDQGWCDIHWLHPDGRAMEEADWNGDRRLVLLYSTHVGQKQDSPVEEAVAILFNAADAETEFRLPDGLPPAWTLRFSSSVETMANGTGRWRVPAQTLVLLTSEVGDP